MNGYNVVLKECSKELTRKEELIMKDTSDAVKLDMATDEGAIIFHPTAYAVLGVHNEQLEEPDYDQYLIFCDDGAKYITGSESFWSTFIDIFKTMNGEEEAWDIKAYKLESKNYKGKKFITCSVC